MIREANNDPVDRVRTKTFFSEKRKMSTPVEPIVLPSFASKEDAIEWMDAKVDDPCTDNYRFAFVADAAAMEEYDDQVQSGCCGFFDEDVIVDGKKATIGCNFGH